MTNNIQKDFEQLIKTLTTEISKEVLLEDMKSIRSSFSEMQQKYNNTYNGYSNEVANMKGQVLDFGAYTSKAMKHTDDLSRLNDSQGKMVMKMNEVLKELEESKENVLEKILQDNEMAFKQFKEKVSRLNKEEEDRFLKAIQSELAEAEERVSALNEDIRQVIVKIDFNREKVLEEMLAKNAEFAEAYQRNIADFNNRETQIFMKNLDQYVMNRVDAMEKTLKKLIDEYLREMNQRSELQRGDVFQISKTIQKGNEEYHKALQGLAFHQKELDDRITIHLKNLEIEQKSYQEETKKVIASLSSDMEAMRTNLAYEFFKRIKEIREDIQLDRDKYVQQKLFYQRLFIGAVILVIALMYIK